MSLHYGFYVPAIFLGFPVWRPRFTLYVKLYAWLDVIQGFVRRANWVVFAVRYGLLVLYLKQIAQVIKATRQHHLAHEE